MINRSLGSPFCFSQTSNKWCINMTLDYHPLEILNFSKNIKFYNSKCIIFLANSLSFSFHRVEWTPATKQIYPLKVINFASNLRPGLMTPPACHPILSIRPTRRIHSLQLQSILWRKAQIIDVAFLIPVLTISPYKKKERTLNEGAGSPTKTTQKKYAGEFLFHRETAIRLRVIYPILRWR